MMRKIGVILLAFFCCAEIIAQEENVLNKERSNTADGSSIINREIEEDYALSHVIEDIYLTSVEEGLVVDFEDLQEQLLAINQHKININTATYEDLQELYFLADDKIDRVLIYRDQHPIHNVYELQLIPGLREWEYRFLALFVEAGPEKEHKIYARELFKHAAHEVNYRFDVRNIESSLNEYDTWKNQADKENKRFTGDPFYTSIKYKFYSFNRLEFGITLERDAGEPLFAPKVYGFDHYGGYLQLKNIGHFKTIVLGDYKANFGMGLVIGEQMRMGKSDYISQFTFGKQGLRKYSSTDEYHFFRGGGATVDLGIVDISAWYSYKGIDANLQNGAFPSITQTGYHRTETEIARKKVVGQHVAGVNTTLHIKRLRIGITAIENILSDTLRPKPTYYNEKYFRGRRQTVVGGYFQWNIWRMQVFGEVATAENKHWGIGSLVGTKISPVEDVHLMAIGRYYSPWFDNLFASAFGETSKNNDELGLYVGGEVSLVKNWRFSMYGDIFKFSGPKYGIKDTIVGYELQAKAEWKRYEKIQMSWQFRCKDKAEKEKYNLRYLLEYKHNGWRIRSHIEGNVCRNANNISGLGILLAQDAEYAFKGVPIVVQTRAEMFDIRHWDNRIYAYENDVMYAFTIPASYGVGGRWYLNSRYKINEHYSLYLKVAETVYTKGWVEQQKLTAQTKTDIHFLLRITY